MYFEDYQPGSSMELGPVSLTEAEIIAFALDFDAQPLHTDRVAAAEGPYRGIIASGWHTCAVTMRALVNGYLSAESSIVSPGIDQVRWLAPVRPDDSLTVRVTVLESRRSRSKPDRGSVHAAIETTNQDGVSVLTFTAVNIIKTRPDQD